ncbi:MAG: hypothetical protein D6736_01840 [Nitrospinota bacterium]|nr:MAG: hypothetical protein D6736_01840 [Nitrospinota bacterium]
MRRNSKTTRLQQRSRQLFWSGKYSQPLIAGLLFLVMVLTLLGVLKGTDLLPFHFASGKSGMVESALAEQNPPSAETGGEEQEPAQSVDILTLTTTDIPLLKSLQERKAALDRREKELEEKENALRLLQQQLEERLATLSLLRKEMEELLQEKKAFEEKRFEHLVKVYEGMKPEEAASLIEQLQEETAVRLLYRMREKKVSQILEMVKPEVAARISERLLAQSQSVAQKEEKR